MRQFIDIVENAQSGLDAITSEQVIAYARDPASIDVHAVYEEQIDIAFDGERDALDRWLRSMVGDVKAQISGRLRRHRVMYRGFSGPVREPLGIHWTTSTEIAQEFGTRGEVVEAYIDINTIDWLGTVVRGIFWDDAQEDELCLIRGSEIRLTDGRTGRA